MIESVADVVRTDGRAVVLSGMAARADDEDRTAALADQRVAAVRDGLVAKGVPERRIVIQPSWPATEISPRVQIDLRPAP